MPTSLTGHRIAIVLTTLDLGGAERQALHLASYLQDIHGASVAIVALFGGTGNQILRRHCNQRRLACLRVNMPEHHQGLPTSRSVRQFARDMRFLRPDILLPYTTLPNILCGLTWRIIGAKTCIWNQRDTGLELSHAGLCHAALANTPHFIANSHPAMNCLIQEYNVPSSRVHIVFNGVQLAPPQESRPALRRRLGIAEDSFVGVMLATLYPVKDHATLVRAWKGVIEQSSRASPNAIAPTLLLAGRDVESTALRQLIAELRLDPSVRLPGPIDDISSLLHASDLCVFSSDNEGLPNAILESMAAGLPVVATDIPGCRDALGGSYRFLIPPHSPDLFAAAILNFAHNPALRDQTRTDLQSRATTHFTLDAMCQATAQLLADTLRSP